MGKKGKYWVWILNLLVVICFLSAHMIFAQGKSKDKSKEGKHSEVEEEEVEEQKDRGKKRDKETKGREIEREEKKDEIGKMPHPEDRDWVPPGLEGDEAAKWQSEGPPGWTKGEKEGWKGGNMPPGLQKKLPPQHEERNFWERWKWNRDLKSSKKEIQSMAENKGLDQQDKTSAEIALESAAKSGVPIEEVREVLKKAIEKKQNGKEMEVITKAMSYGVGKNTDFRDMGTFVNQKLEEGVAGKDLAVQIYKRIAGAQ